MTPVTVLMPAFNAAAYIRQAIDSVLAQSFADFELLVINDGSTDDTAQIVASYNDKRIELINTLNNGISKTLNLGIDLAKGEYIARFDADDICMPYRLEKQFTFLNSHEDYVLVGSDANFISAAGDYVYTHKNQGYTNQQIQALPASVCGFVHSSVMYRKKAVLAAGGYDEHAHTFEDHLLWKKLLKQGKALNTREILVQQRFNPSSVTIDERWRSREYLSIKAAAIQRGYATRNEGERLKKLLQQQDTASVKEGSYYALMGKKYLWNNYRPAEARKHFAACLKVRPHMQVALLWCLSFFPKGFINLLYSSTRKFY